LNSATIPPIRKASQMAEVATAATSPSRAKIPAPTIEPTPNETARATVIAGRDAERAALLILDRHHVWAADIEPKPHQCHMPNWLWQ
jgi:hypothetical protein